MVIFKEMSAEESARLVGWSLWGGARVQILIVLQKALFRAKWKLLVLTEPEFILREERMMPLRETLKHVLGT